MRKLTVATRLRARSCHAKSEQTFKYGTDVASIPGALSSNAHMQRASHLHEECIIVGSANLKYPDRHLSLVEPLEPTLQRGPGRIEALKLFAIQELRSLIESQK